MDAENIAVHLGLRSAPGSYPTNFSRMSFPLRKDLYLLLMVTLAFFPGVRTFGMQSSNYIIEKDSINFSGSDESTSANYKLSDTAGEVGSGVAQCPAGSCNLLNGGYRQNDTVVAGGSYISINNPSDVTLSPTIGGVAGGVGDGSATWKVTTSNLAGYQLDIKSTTSPSLQTGSYDFLDYVPAGSDPDFAWSVSANDSRFGYSVEGGDTASKFLDNSSACATGSSNALGSCWLGFSTSNETVATSALPNDPTGTDTTVKFRAEAGNQRMQENGIYTATIVVTAVEL